MLPTGQGLPMAATTVPTAEQDQFEAEEPESIEAVESIGVDG